MISVVTLTHNDENIIARFLANSQFADEIIVLDQHSTDNTINLAKTKKVSVFEVEFTDFNTVKPFAISKATHSWILFLKPNEKASEALITEIKGLISNNAIASYRIKSQLNFMGKVLKYCNSGDTLRNRLINANNITTGFKTLKNPLTCDYLGFDSYNDTLTKQAKADANVLIKNNVRPNVYHFLLKPFFSLIKHYVLKLGFLDGKEGFIYSYLMAFTVFKRYLYVWLNYRNLN